MEKHAEILAPAGGEAQLRAAVLCGADAVVWSCAALMHARAPKTLTKTPCRRPLAGAMPAG